MKTAPITALKNRLSHYLRLVARGESVTIVDRGRPVARLTRIEGEEGELGALVAAGLARPPLRPLPKDFLRRRLPRATASVQQALLEDRDDRFYVRYWDASALVPLCVTEPSTRTARELTAAGIVTWSVSAVEIASAIERRTRETRMSVADRVAARMALDELSAAWTEITALGPVRDRALRLVATHALRAADAMQLAAALVAVSDRPQGHDFVCADGRLRQAASREGFRILPDEK